MVRKTFINKFLFLIEKKSFKGSIKEWVNITAIATGILFTSKVANIKTPKSFPDVMGIMKRTMGILGRCISTRVQLTI